LFIVYCVLWADYEAHIIYAYCYIIILLWLSYFNWMIQYTGTVWRHIAASMIVLRDFVSSTQIMYVNVILVCVCAWTSNCSKVWSLNIFFLDFPVSALLYATKHQHWLSPKRSSSLDLDSWYCGPLRLPSSRRRSLHAHSKLYHRLTAGLLLAPRWHSCFLLGISCLHHARKSHCTPFAASKSQWSRDISSGRRRALLREA